MTKAVPEERPARSNRRDRDVIGAMRVNRSWYENALAESRLREKGGATSRSSSVRS